MTNLDSILRSRDITLSTKLRLVKAMVFPVVMYECDSWTIKKAECWRIDTFELWCWRRLLRLPWTARRSNQSILKEISPGCSWEGLIVGAEPPILWPPDAKNWLIGKDPDAGKDWREEEKGTTEDEMVGWHHQLNGRGFGWTLGVGEGQGGLACCNSWGRKKSDMTECLNWLTAWLCPTGLIPNGSDHKELPAVQTCFWSLGWENPLEKGMATHCSILAWRLPWTEELGGL